MNIQQLRLKKKNECVCCRGGGGGGNELFNTRLAVNTFGTKFFVIVTVHHFYLQELKTKYGGDSMMENTSSSKIQLNTKTVGGGFSCCGS